MPPPTDQDMGPLSTPSAVALCTIRDEILSAWEGRLRSEFEEADQLTTPALINTFPKVIDNLVEALEVNHPRANANESNTLAIAHGGERARLSKYRPDQIVREYQIMREVILDRLPRACTLTDRDKGIIQKSIDSSIQGAMVSFFLVHTQLKEQFVATLTHDLRNPLSAAKMTAEIMLGLLNREGDSPLKANLIRMTNRILGNTKRVDRMVQDLLDTSLLQTGDQLPLKIQECEILSITQDAILDFPAQEQARIVVGGRPAQGFWDASALMRAVENLVGNAIKYGDEHRPITVRVEPAFERVQISVHNEGNPMSPLDQKILFEPYQRSSSAKASGKKGWGIGLSLTRGIVLSHCGSLVVDSSPERGTTFIIDIPLDARAAQKAAETTRPEQKPA